MRTPRLQRTRRVPSLPRGWAGLTTVRHGRRGFSVIELMLAISLMGVIVFALYGMFTHTQKALRSNATQVDVMESGRATMDLLTREFAQMNMAHLPGGTNFLSALAPVGPNLQEALRRDYQPVIQNLFEPNTFRTNHRQGVFFLSRFNREYQGTAFWVFDATNGVGTLGRFTTNLSASLLNSNTLMAMTTNVMRQPATNFLRLADGVVHFRVRPFDADGNLFDWRSTNRYTNLFLYTNIYPGTNLLVFRDKAPSESGCVFLSNLAPAGVEIELGVLEPQVLQQFKAFPANSPLAVSFLTNRAGQVHLFRQRVPVRQSTPTRSVFR